MTECESKECEKPVWAQCLEMSEAAISSTSIKLLRGESRGPAARRSTEQMP